MKDTKHTLIIAEAGVNHNGSVERALEMVAVAAACGADMIKFQTFSADLLASPEAPLAGYQRRGETASGQYEMLKRLELDEDAHLSIIAACRTHNIEFISSPFDLKSIALLQKLGCRYIKIPSGEITNLPYLQAVARTGCRIILSTGMATLGEVDDALAVLYASGTTKDQLTVLHCTSEYPCPAEDVNLRSMLTLAAHTGLPYGYSDHTRGIEVAIGAVAMGATVIEKHFTLDPGLPGPDHAASLDPEGLRQMVDAIRIMEKALGSGDKVPVPAELINRTPARKSIFSAREIQKGDIITADALLMKRPGDGISPMLLNSILGRRAGRDIPSGHKLSEDDLL